VLELLETEGVYDTAVTRLGYPDRYIEQGEQPELRAIHGLDPEGIATNIRKLFK
jgi:1-deoxy-D-xylulose-5-phosphate synthase